MGISLDDLCRLTIHQFVCARDAWTEEREDSERCRWERMRTLAAITVQPHTRRRVTPRALLPFPWDRTRDTAPVQGKDEAMARMRMMMNKIKNHGDRPGGDEEKDNKA